MRVSLGQIIILLLIIFLLFGDFQKMKKRLTEMFKNMNKLLNKNKKKGT